MISVPSDTASQSGARNILVLVVYTAAIFTSALLLFSVQPLFTKMVLPRLGGSPAVWSVAMVFFQSLLLGGYAYAHYLMTLKSRTAHVVIHLVLLTAALLTLPLSIASGWGEPPASGYAFWLLGLFAVSIGLPFFALAANNPMLQAWFVRTGHPDGPSVFSLCVFEHWKLPRAAVLSGAARADVLAADPEPDLDQRLRIADRSDRGMRRNAVALAADDR